MNEQDQVRGHWDFGPFALEQYYPDGMTVWITVIEATKWDLAQVVKDVQWTGKIVQLPIPQLKRWGLWTDQQHPMIFLLGKYRLRVVDRNPAAQAVICVRDNYIWWVTPLRSWLRQQGMLIHWRTLLTLQIWNVAVGVNTEKPLDEQHLKWFPAWRKGGKE